MSMWAWIVVGAGVFLVLSLLVGLAVAAVFRSIGRRVSELYETEVWALAPLERAERDAKSRLEDAKKHDRVIRLR
jgi:hypothetical protein